MVDTFGSGHLYLGRGKHDLVLGAHDPEASQRVVELLPQLESDDPLTAPVIRSFEGGAGRDDQYG